MVGEFPELQGLMGRYYAGHDGESPAVAAAIEQHYWPRFAGDALPDGPVAQAVALADKLEALAGMFGIGNVPTGDKDPFGLRRAALGVLRIVIERQLPLPLPDLARRGVRGLRRRRRGEARAPTRSRAFIYDRLRGYLRDHGLTAQPDRGGGRPAPGALSTSSRRGSTPCGRSSAARGGGAGRGEQADRQHPAKIRRRGRPRGRRRRSLLTDGAEHELHAGLPEARRPQVDALCAARRLRRRALQALATAKPVVDRVLRRGDGDGRRPRGARQPAGAAVAASRRR